MSDMDNMRVFADQLWKYMVPKLDSKFASNVSFFRAQVVSNPGGNMLEVVQRPLETNTLTLPCTTAMSGASVGQQVAVLVMGSLSNAVVVADGKMNFPYLPLTGGTLTGNLVVRPAGTPQVALIAPEKEGVGRSRTTLYKNASATADYGTTLVDYVWGNGSNTNKRTAVRVLSNTVSLKDRLVMIDYADGGSYVVYHLYGEHNQPTIADVTGLEARLTDIENRLTALENQ